MLIVRMLFISFFVFFARFLTNGLILGQYNFNAPFPDVSWWGVAIGGFICLTVFSVALNYLTNSDDPAQKIAAIFLLFFVCMVFLFTLIGFTSVTAIYGFSYLGVLIFLICLFVFCSFMTMKEMEKRKN